MSSAYRKWTKEEEELLAQWLEENPDVPVGRGAKDLLPLLDGKTVAQIGTKLYRMREKFAKKEAYPTHPQQKHVASTMAERIHLYVKQLHQIADSIQGELELLEVLERWATDTQTLRNRLRVKVDKHGVVHSVKKEEE